MKIKYVANDGTEFDTEEACKEYEEEIKIYADVNSFKSYFSKDNLNIIFKKLKEQIKEKIKERKIPLCADNKFYVVAISSMYHTIVPGSKSLDDIESLPNNHYSANHTTYVYNIQVVVRYYSVKLEGNYVISKIEELTIVFPFGDKHFQQIEKSKGNIQLINI